MKADTPRLPFARPLLGQEEADAAVRALSSGWITQGTEVAALEREFASAVGAAHACAVSSGTAALALALTAAGVKTGDEVVTVSHSFIATSNSIRHVGATPVFVDIDDATFNMDPRLIEDAITPRTTAILCVHQLGMPCDLAAIVAIARRRSLPVIEDAACAVGSDILWEGRWEPVGRPHGDAACFSLHARKLLTCGEGGIVTTPHPDWDARIRLCRHQGMSISDRDRHDSPEVMFESYPAAGFNYRLTDIQAAIAREQLRRLPGMVAERRILADRYRGLLESVEGIVAPHEPAWGRSNWQSYCVRLPDGANQRRIMQRMLDAGVPSRRGVMCAHREPPYRHAARRPLVRSEAAQDGCILLPMFNGMRAEEQDVVVRCLRDALERC